MPGQGMNHVSPSISSLPAEIIEKIGNLSSPSAVLALSRALPGLTPHLEPALWGEVSLAHPAHFGEYPLIQPKGTDEDGWARGLAKEGEIRNRVRLGERAKAMMMRGDERRWGYARRLRIASRPVAVHHLAQVLEFAAPSVRALELEGPPKHIFQDDWPPILSDTLEYHIFGRHIPFPFLTHLRIASGTLQYPALILVLVDHAPNLEVLDVDMEAPYELIAATGAGDSPLGLSEFHLPDRKSKSLRQMRVFCAQTSEETQDHGAILSHLLIRSCKLEQLAIAYDGEDEDIRDEIIEELEGMESLRDLQWRAQIGVFHDVDAVRPGFHRLRRLVYQFDQWDDIFQHLPALGALESLYCRGVPPDFAEDLPSNSQALPSNTPSPYSHQSMIPEFSEGLRCCPRLSAIHFISEANDYGLNIFTHLDDVEAGIPTGMIRSLRHDGEIILHARLRMPYETVVDMESGSTVQVKNDMLRIYYPINGQHRLKLLARIPEPVWHDYTDYNGFCIPLSLVDRVASLAGLPSDWSGRGVEVDGDAWAILADWLDDGAGSHAGEGRVALNIDWISDDASESDLSSE